MKRVLTAGAVGLGIGSMGAAMREDGAERDANDAGQHDEHEHPPDLVLVFAHDYRSNALFRPIDRLPQGAVNSILGRRVNGSDPVVSEPTDYNGYVVLVKRTPNAPGEYTFVFVNQQTLQQDQWYRFTDDVVFFDTRISLLSVALTTGAGVGETPTTTEQTTVATTTETTTPADETTTHEVVVETTETSDSE
jgi:hypothetical protein